MYQASILEDKSILIPYVFLNNENISYCEYASLFCDVDERVVYIRFVGLHFYIGGYHARNVRKAQKTKNGIKIKLGSFLKLLNIFDINKVVNIALYNFKSYEQNKSRDLIGFSILELKEKI